jgi:phosphoribosyl 1,2-cyclic phosphodiesterase
MEICALASGSSGNCFYVGDKNSAVLVDVGISAKQVVLRAEERGLEMEKVKGILVTHEHIDHIRGIDVLSRNMRIPIFATEKTIKNNFICKDESLLFPIKNNERFNVGALNIETFKKSHKAIDPVFFGIEAERKRVSVITDAGKTCKNIHDEIANSNFLCLESNHDPKMLENGPYPYFLKKWVGGDDGHLSNMQAALGVLEYSSTKLKNVILSHLSKTNNTPQLAIKTFQNLLKERNDFGAEVIVSNRDVPTEVFRI